MKRMIKKITVLMAVLLLSCADLWAGSTSWKIKDCVLYISGEGDMPNYSYYSEAPWKGYQDEFSKVLINYGVTSIGAYAFSGCENIENVTIPGTVTRIGKDAFSGCVCLTSVAIPGSVTSIGWYAFKNCESLTSVTIQDGVTSIGRNMFEGCIDLTSVTIPGSVTGIGEEAFKNCESLTSVTIPCTVTRFGASAFSGCTGLTSVTIQDGVTSIEKSMFLGCTGLTSVTIPSSVTSIEDDAFSGCTGLTSVTIQEGMTSIGGRAFEGCTGLTNVTIPRGVIYIWRGAFLGCTGLKLIKMNAVYPPFCRYGFDYNCSEVFDNSCYETCELAVPTESLNRYKTTVPWSYFLNIVSSGITDAKADAVKVAAADGAITVSGAADDAVVEVFDVNGVLIYRGAGKSVTVPSAGFYVVRVAGQTYKVAVN